MTNQTLIATISRYFATFGRKPDAEIVAAYAMTLRDLAPQQVEAAFLAAMRKPTDHPLTAGQLYALGVTGGLDAETLAERAFQLLDEVLGAEYPLDFEDKRINATVRELGGLQRLSEVPLEEFHVWTRKAFLAAYRRYLVTPPNEEQSKPLRGTLGPDHRMWDGRSLGEIGALRIGRDERGKAIKALPPPSETPAAIEQEKFGLRLKQA